MPATLRALVGGLLATALLAACSAAPGAPTAKDTDPTPASKPAKDAVLTTGTCWSGTSAGADPQRVLALSRRYGVSYFAAAHALADRPAFDRTEACSGDHDVEVYKAVAMGDVPPAVTTYAALLRAGTPAFSRIGLAVERACMNQTLVDAAASTGLPGALMSPAFPDGVELGWAPPSEGQWLQGQRAYACTLTQDLAGPLQYASVFTRAFPTEDRTCIDNSSLTYVDCARKHERERIAVIDVQVAVAAGKFPGARAVRTGSSGRYVDVSPAQYAALDRACTVFLHAVSTTTRLTGVAEVDPDVWPAPDGSYPVDCEADTSTTKRPISTEGSVFDR
jgi:hypothetical protein